MLNNSNSILLKRSSVIDCLYFFNREERPLYEEVDKFHSITMLAHEALESFIQLQLNNFDPLVGDNACQLRAAIFIKLINQPDVKEELSKILDVIKEVKTILEEEKKIRSKKTRLQLLNEKKEIRNINLRQYLTSLGGGG